MQPIHVFLCLMLWRYSGAAQRGCTRLPEVENADISGSSIKTNYTEGDLLHFTCRVGYVSSRRITYTCEDGRWTTRRQIKCSPKQCELPEDIVNGHYELVNGTDFVFGAVIKYTCNEGYMLVGRSATRLCMSEGWSDRVPTCEVVKCLGQINDTSVLVNGLGDDNSVSYGHVLHFKCASADLTLQGESEVACLSNGKWSSAFPTCGGIEHGPTQTSSAKDPQPWWYCGPPPLIPYGDIIGLRKDMYRHGEHVEYQCKSYYKPFGKKSIRCVTGEWEDPPICLEPCIVTIEEMDRQGIELKFKSPQKLYVEHGDRVEFRCKYRKRHTAERFIQYCANGKMTMPRCV